MITDIEKLVEYDADEGYLKADKIGETIAKQAGIPGRDLNVIFNYISGGRTLNRYIKDRKMMATYKMMIKDEDYDIQSYLDCSGFEVESSFSRVFSEKFGVPPTTAHKQRDETKIEGPITIDKIINGSDLPKGIDDKPRKVFGLPKDMVDRYNDICDYQALFGFKDQYVELAVYLNEERGVSLYDAFSSVESLVTDYEDVASRDTLESLLFYVDKVVPALYVKHLYKKTCLPELNEWYFHMKDEGGNLLEETPEFVYAYFDDTSNGFTYAKLKSLYTDYLKRCEEAKEKRRTNEEKNKADRENQIVELKKLMVFLEKHRSKLEKREDYQEKYKENVEKRIDDTKRRIYILENSIDIEESGDDFKDYLQTVQMYGSIEAYEDFMDEVQKDYEETGNFLELPAEKEKRLEHVLEDTFWADYDEKHFRNM